MYLWLCLQSAKQSILKEINPENSLEGLMLKLKLQYLWLPDAKSWLVWKDPDAGKDQGQEVKGATEDEVVGWHHQLNGHEWVWANSGRQWRTGKTGMLQSMGSQIVRHDWATEQQPLSARCFEHQLRWYNGKLGFHTSLGLTLSSPICNLCCCSYCCW